MPSLGVGRLVRIEDAAEVRSDLRSHRDLRDMRHRVFHETTCPSSNFQESTVGLGPIEASGVKGIANPRPVAQMFRVLGVCEGFEK
jgi:hypothetical protein